jgi:hypothetical protein
MISPVEEVARAALGEPRAELLEAVLRPIEFDAVNPATAGLLRCLGHARVGGRVREFRAVVKIARRPEGEPDSLAHWNSWKREALFYASHHRGVRQAGLTVPKFYAQSRGENGERWLWMEEVRESGATQWSIARHALAARHLGQFGAAHLGRIPRGSWVSKNWLRNALEQRHAAIAMLEDPDTWNAPEVRRAFPIPVQVRVLHLYEHAEALLDVLDAMPQTLCHFDAYRANLFARGQQTVAIDWAFVGAGALGVDLGQMIAGDLMWLFIDPAHAPRYLDAVLDGYLRGGHRARASQVRRAAFLSASLRLAGYLPYLLTLLRDPLSWRKKFPGPISQSAPRFGRAAQLLLSLAQKEWPAF